MAHQISLDIQIRHAEAQSDFLESHPELFRLDQVEHEAIGISQFVMDGERFPTSAGESTTVCTVKHLELDAFLIHQKNHLIAAREIPLAKLRRDALQAL